MDAAAAVLHLHRRWGRLPQRRTQEVSILFLGFDNPSVAPPAPAIASPAAFGFHDAAVLGTRLNLQINAATHAQALAAALRARAEIDRLNAVLNWRDPDSELGRLNRARRHVASPDLFEVVLAAETWRAASDEGYSGRLGRVLDLWRRAHDAPPQPAEAQRLATAAREARVELDPARRAVVRPQAVQFDLDGLAKGYIVDRALEAVLRAPGVKGALVDIGGEIRCAGPAPDADGWRVGLPDPLMPYDNAPLIGRLTLRDAAVATSGCGPRDRLIGGQRFSATLDPRTGWPVPHRCSASVIAPTAMAADALATAVLNLPEADAARLVAATPGAAARLAQPQGAVWLPGEAPAAWTPVQTRPAIKASPGGRKWPERYVAFVTFTAPPKQMKRDIAFRSPYVAIWVTDLQNRPVRTLVLIGSIKEWQQDNYIWWGQNRADAMELVSSRSLSTRGSGEYKVLWDGTDEAGKMVPAGRYILHVETSRERGRHTFRSLELDLAQPRSFTTEIPTSEEAGGVVVRFDRF